ncbi:MAG: DUF4428 domain-containing protein [Clostridia bacterium]|nr:DUF4428 domain-containing protein [Clostridia bacterium]
MAIKNCSICQKEVGFLGRFELRDGYICDDCYNAVREKYSIKDFDNAMTTVSDIKNGIFANPVKFVKEQVSADAVSAPVKAETKATTPSKIPTPAPEVTPTAPTAVESGEGCFEQMQNGCGCIIYVAIAAVVIWFLWFWLSGGLGEFTDKLFNAAGEAVEESIDEYSQQYIDMVKNAKIGNTDVTYGDFAAEFEKQEWNYFIGDGGEQVVEFIGDIDLDTVRTVRVQYVISPYGENRYLIEPAYMDIDGVAVDDILSMFFLMM